MKIPHTLRALPLGRIALTVAALAVAAMLARILWTHEADTPWTRDARVRADVIHIAPDVGGLVDTVPVRDNQPVRRGDLLFTVDAARFHNAADTAAARLAMAQAALQSARAQVRERQEDLAKARTAMQMDEDRARRRRFAGGYGATSREEVDDADAAAAMARNAWHLAQSRLAQARADTSRAIARRDLARTALQLAQLDLQRTEIRAPVDGFVTNLLLRPGDYVHVGQPVMALIDRHSYYLYGYFEESKLADIRPGDHARIRLLSDPRCLAGTVEAIARGIGDRDNPTGPDLLLDANPVFDWVRLAQRIPVRIHIDSQPADLPLSAGMSATVTILPREGTARSTAGNGGGAPVCNGGPNRT